MNFIKLLFVLAFSISISITKQGTINGFNCVIRRTINEAMLCTIRVVIKPGALFKTLNGYGTTTIHISITQH